MKSLRIATLVYKTIRETGKSSKKNFVIGT